MGKVVYICIPYSDDPDEGIRNARRYARIAHEKGYVPIASHLLFPEILNMDNKQENKAGLVFLLSHCDELWAFGEKLTDGMRKEISTARELRINIKFLDNDGNEALKIDFL